jgi:hypothetical protein
MPVSIEEIREFLDKKDVKYLFDAQKETFIISFTPHVVLIRLEENGEFLQFRTLNFYQYKAGKYREQILELVGSLNYRRKLIKFGYDPDDGEINGCVDIPIEDSAFTSTQFFRCLAALLEALEEGRRRLNMLLETGKDPGQRPAKTSETPSLPASKEAGKQPPKAIDRLVNEIMESMDEPKQDKPEKKDEPNQGEKS